MATGITPHVISLIDWTNAETCPVRRQFLPLASELQPDHPMAGEDSLGERSHTTARGVVRRYPRKALLIATTTCPVYCTFCTRSYAVGPGHHEQAFIAPGSARDDPTIERTAGRGAVRDIVISGGDASNLSPTKLISLIDGLLAERQATSIRIGTRVATAVPYRLLPSDAWGSALQDAAQSCREADVRFAVHIHVNSSAEISDDVADALRHLHRNGIVARSQTVLLAGVNDTVERIATLIDDLIALHVDPYYVFQCDMVPGIEHLRTPLSRAITLEKELRGLFPGFLTPRFVVDLPGGGGKRDVHSFESYDERTGLSRWRSPVIDPERSYSYFDPLHALEVDQRLAWTASSESRTAISRRGAGPEHDEGDADQDHERADEVPAIGAKAAEGGAQASEATTKMRP
jgi:lysine 2,3-aminomutase